MSAMSLELSLLENCENVRQYSPVTEPISSSASGSNLPPPYPGHDTCFLHNISSILHQLENQQQSVSRHVRKLY